MKDIPWMTAVQRSLEPYVDTEAGHTGQYDEAFLGESQWFVPVTRFFTTLRSLQPQPELWFDIGTGLGKVPEAANEQGIKMIGVDPYPRKGYNAMRILSIPGQDIEYTATRWPLICRPCHNGFAFDVIEKSLAVGGCAVYVGLERNVGDDIGQYLLQVVKKVKNVGKEGESLWFIKPRPVKPKRATTVKNPKRRAT